MFQRLLQHKGFLLIAGTLPLVFAAAPYGVAPFTVLGCWFMVHLTTECRTFKQSFIYGFCFASLMMFGIFYWIAYVLHEFGYLPWPIAILTYFGFLLIAAWNFPFFFGFATLINEELRKRKNVVLNSLWFSAALPALFVVAEYAIPKLFPWYIGSGLYALCGLIQICEFTGVLFLSFAVLSVSSTLAVHLRKDNEFPYSKLAWVVPMLAWSIMVGFGVWRIHTPFPPGKNLKVLMVQANIGSLEKVEAEKGILNKVNHVVNRYLALTERELAKSKPDLIMWPETAIPFRLDYEMPLSKTIFDKVKEWNVPLLTGAYSMSERHYDRDYNAAFLLAPLVDAHGRFVMRKEIYPKNVLLAFGEYLPLGDTFPVLYRWLPQVSNFERGKEQMAFHLEDGTRLGMTICYEDILTGFVRKVAHHGIQVLLNLTNDSWFGPTHEPYQHAEVTIFRAVEFRIPIVRVTNTGTSIIVDRLGRILNETPVYEESTLTSTVEIPDKPVFTFYLRYGDWFVGLSALFLLGFVIMLKRYAPISH